MQDSVAGNLFEGSNVRKLKASNRYLALIEAYNSESLGRSFYPAPSDEGTFIEI